MRLSELSFRGGAIEAAERVMSWAMLNGNADPCDRPEYTVYDFDNYRYHKGSNLMIGNFYPSDYTKGFYEGMKSAGQEEIVSLVRCAWAGSQKYGALVWSGDIASRYVGCRSR